MMDKVLLIYGDIRKLKDDNFSLSEDRQKKVDSFKFEDDKKRCILAELILKQGLSLLGENIEVMNYTYNSNGKPYIKDSDIYFNLSHSGDYVVCALSNNEIGIDIQKIEDINLNIANSYFLKEESEKINELSSREDKLNLFYDYWTKKEAYIKAIGEGIRKELNTFDVSNDDIGYIFKKIDEFDGYKCYVCYKDDIDIELLEYDYERKN